MDMRSALKKQAPKKNNKPEAPTAPEHSKTSNRAPYRVGQVNISAWFPTEVRQQLKVIAAQEDMTLRELLAEALDDLFQKYNHSRIAGSRGDEK